MLYTEEKINKYLNIINNYKKNLNDKSTLALCKGCKKKEFFDIYFGQRICCECGVLNGHVLGLYDVKDYDRVHYKKKSVYYRKYYFNKKIYQISKIINLSDEEKCKLYNRLMSFNLFISKCNQNYSRNRMISTNYVIKKILVEINIEKSKKMNNKISLKTLEKYDRWWEYYKELLK